MSRFAAPPLSRPVIRPTIVLALLTVAACGSDPDPSGTPTGDADDGANGQTVGDSGQNDSWVSGDSSGGSDTASGTDGDPSDDGDDDPGDDTGGDDDPPASGMPTAIPTPSFGYLHDTTTPEATVYVDNSNPNCDDTLGTAVAPRCDLFAGANAVSLSAGDVVHIAGGPYLIDGDKTLSFAGTQDNPVILRTEDDASVRFDAQGSRADFTYEGQYAIIENIDFFDNTRHTIATGAHHLTLRGVQVHNPEGAFIDFNPIVQIAGHDILVYQSMIYDNRRMSDLDSHGINAGSGSYNLWILDNELYNNNGDSFQGCHECFDQPPHHVYIGRNVLHEDRENAVDLKTIHDVVVSDNIMYGYAASETSSGDAMVIGSNGYDESTGQGPRRVWVFHNEFRDSTRGLRIEGVEDVWLVGNVFTSVGTAIQIDNKEYRDIVIAANTIDDVDDGIVSWNDGCSADSMTVLNNLIGNVADLHLELPSCDNATLTNNLVWGDVAVRIGGPSYDTAAAIDALPFASGHLDVDPQFEMGTLRPAEGSPPVDTGASLDSYLEAVEAAYGGDAHRDFSGAPRPDGGIPDIGAYER